MKKTILRSNKGDYIHDEIWKALHRPISAHALAHFGMTTDKASTMVWGVSKHPMEWMPQLHDIAALVSMNSPWIRPYLVRVINSMGG